MALLAGLAIAKIGLGFLSSRSKNKALARQAAANNAFMLRRVKELKRQQRAADLQFQGQKSDVALEIDKRLGMARAMAAEGGRTTAGLARMSGAIAGRGGLFRARLERQRYEGAAARRYEQEATREDVANQRSQLASQARSNTINFLASTASTMYGGYQDGVFSGMGVTYINPANTIGEI